MTEETPINDQDGYGLPNEYDPDSYQTYYADRYFNREHMLENLQDDRQLDELSEEVLE